MTDLTTHPWYTRDQREPSLLAEDIDRIADEDNRTPEQVRAQVFPPFPDNPKSSTSYSVSR